jgi:hypothetical protein
VSDICEDCAGTGWGHPDNPHGKCDWCDGKGECDRATGPSRVVEEIRKTLLEFGDCDPMLALRLVRDFLDGRTEPTER